MSDTTQYEDYTSEFSGEEIDARLRKVGELPNKYVGEFFVSSDGNTVLGEVFNDYANNKAQGQYSHAQGQSTIATADCQHVEGRFNVEDTDKEFAHVVGNGTDDSNRSNAMTLDWKGNMKLSGDVTANVNGKEVSMSAIVSQIGDITTALSSLVEVTE